MQHIRRRLLSIMVWAVVTAALVGGYGLAGASPTYTTSEPPSVAASSSPGLPNPNTGEPDSGSTQGQHTTTTLQPSAPSAVQQAIQALRAMGWNGLVWARQFFGIGE